MSVRTAMTKIPIQSLAMGTCRCLEILIFAVDIGAWTHVGVDRLVLRRKQSSLLGHPYSLQNEDYIPNRFIRVTYHLGHVSSKLTKMLTLYYTYIAWRISQICFLSLMNIFEDSIWRRLVLINIRKRHPVVQNPIIKTKPLKGIPHLLLLWSNGFSDFRRKTNIMMKRTAVSIDLAKQ